MSALAHYFEEAGLPSVAISLVREQAQRVRPPRALWVPFELGRPFGPPSDKAFQTRVVVAALTMLLVESGPVLLEDFPDEDPRAAPDPSWRAPALPPVPQPGVPERIAEALLAEIDALDRSYRLSVEARGGRTAVGLSGLAVKDAAAYSARFLRGGVLESPSPELSPALALRYAADDLKAYYTDAALAGTARPSSRQIADWFWNGTAAAAAILALRRLLLESGNERLKLVAAMFLVPGARVPGA